jgi:hypothetical protein
MSVNLARRVAGLERCNTFLHFLFRHRLALFGHGPKAYHRPIRRRYRFHIAGVVGSTLFTFLELSGITVLPNQFTLNGGLSCRLASQREEESSLVQGWFLDGTPA